MKYFVWFFALLLIVIIVSRVIGVYEESDESAILLKEDIATPSGTLSGKKSISQTSVAHDSNAKQHSERVQLILPFSLADVENKRGTLNPFGVVRTNNDRAEMGHSGIDIPLKRNAPLFAVSDGRIVRIEDANDPWGGVLITVLLRDDGGGEGLAFLYEHVSIREGLAVGDPVLQGDIVGYKIAPEDFTVHLQLSHVFNNFSFNRDASCWEEFLESEARLVFNTWWEMYRASPHLKNSWQTIQEDGVYPFRDLLNSERFPSGPALCYPLGTDVRA